MNPQELSPEGFEIREADESDAPFLADIYNQEVRHSHANYETRPQTAAERRQWLILLREKGYPVLVATCEGRPVGFAALTPFHPVSGYRHTVTGSFYVDRNFRGRGVGRRLATALLAAARRRPFHTILAGVNAENRASLALLKSLGFREAGYFREIGRKDGRWFDDVCLQLML